MNAPMLDTATIALRSDPSRTGTRISAPLEGIREKAAELEGVFLNTLMSQMFSSIDTENGFGGGYAEETWRSMQAEQYAQMIAKNGGVGLADQIVAALLDAQEAAQLPAQSTTSHDAAKEYP